MKYSKTIITKDGRECLLRNSTYEDGQAVLDQFILTHKQTDYLFTYPDEITFTVEEEADYLQKKAESENEIEILAVLDGKVVGTAGIEQPDKHLKAMHRADFGISVDKDYWGLGIGRALTRACIECAVAAGYEQLELQAVAENERAIALYESEGFIIYGRNPRGFKSRYSGWQELVLMRMEMNS